MQDVLPSDVGYIQQIMSASSFSVAAAAIGTGSNCFFSSTSIDHHLSLSIFPFKRKPIKNPSKLTNYLNYSLFSPISCSSIHCASTAFDSVELNEDEVEEDPESGAEETVSEVEEEDNDVSQSSDGGRLYVGNLPFTLTSAQLSEIFAEAGRVVSVEIVCNRNTDRSRGFAFVTMGTVDEAKEAIRLFDGSEIGGRTAKVNFPEVPRGGEREVMSPKIRSSYQGFVDSPYKIYAGNLSWNLTSQALRDAFAEQPGYLSSKVIYDRESGRSRGFGFITFSSAEEVDSALNALNGLELEGRPIRLNLAEQKAAASTPSPAYENVSENNLENSEIFSSA